MQIPYMAENAPQLLHATAQQPYIYPYYPFNLGVLTQLALWVDQLPNGQTLTYSVLNPVRMKWLAPVTSHVYDQIQLSIDPENGFVLAMGSLHSRPGMQFVIGPTLHAAPEDTMPVLKSAKSPSLAKTKTEKPSPYKDPNQSFGRPRKDPSQLSPSTLAIYARMAKSKAKADIKPPTAFDIFKKHHEGRDERMGESVVNFMQANAHLPNVHELAQQFFVDQLFYMALRYRMLEVNNNIEKLDESLNDWYAYKTYLCQVITYFGQLLNTSFPDLLNPVLVAANVTNAGNAVNAPSLVAVPIPTSVPGSDAQTVSVPSHTDYVESARQAARHLDPEVRAMSPMQRSHFYQAMYNPSNPIENPDLTPVDDNGHPVPLHPHAF